MADPVDKSYTVPLLNASKRTVVSTDTAFTGAPTPDTCVVSLRQCDPVRQVEIIESIDMCRDVMIENDFGEAITIVVLSVDLDGGKSDVTAGEGTAPNTVIVAFDNSTTTEGLGTEILTAAVEYCKFVLRDEFLAAV